ncbi:hypothetical protein [Candidatus Manganitrophus noduliformans]|uniref:YtkA-like domain-containing protein n=1 Tax=Candidatus Manganitrophus noduliformans TaxID=2606439 RepID=A0A7X6DNA2_9BACT|nr:hypothetical protein [Candidatus Manganitrophus noduliformans]NKE70249.1 hypothetical protein [Candidatus Manganitrophus noduliformans]
MKIISNKIIYGIALFLIALSTAHAAIPEKVTLTPEKAGGGAKGEAVIKEKGKDQKEVTVHATGLKPNSVYTVWVVNMKPKMDMAGVGEGDYSFKSDAKGEGHYTGTISLSELEKWQLLEIALHPDGNPKNMKKIEIALKGDLK